MLLINTINAKEDRENQNPVVLKGVRSLLEELDVEDRQGEIDVLEGRHRRRCS